MYTSVKTKSIVKLAKTSYHSLCTPGAFNVPTVSFNPYLNCDAPDHGVVDFPQNKEQKKIAENMENFIEIKKSQCGNVWGKPWTKHSNKNGRANKYQKQHQSDKK